MVITESELREMWRDGRQPLPAFPPGTRFSPSAHDFIKDHELEIRWADPVPAIWPPRPSARDAAHDPVPITGYPLFAALDSLDSLARLVAAEARRCQLPALARRLDGLADYCHGLRAAEQHGQDPGSWALSPAGLSPEFAPGPTDHAILHWLNFLRATASQAGAQAGAAGRAKLAEALERVSASAADLGRQVQSGALGWNSPMV